MSYEDQIEYILGNFDFDRVQKVMEFLNWEWATVDGVPNHYQLIITAKKYLEECVKKSKDGNYYIASGGFEVELCSGELSLKFVVEDQEGVF